jgi:hypothetical protein
MGEWQSISSIDTGQASIAHGAKTDSDPSIDTSQASIAHGAETDSGLARLPGGDHPAAQHASQDVLTRSAARRGQSAAQRAQPRPSDTECSTQRPEDAASRTTRESRRSGPAEDRTLTRSRLSGAGTKPSLMDGGGTRLHIVEVVTAPSLRRALRQATRAGQLCWTRIWRIHRRCTTASGYTYHGH